ncbi:hypothetical protein, partial [Priestia megaterium]|uniref:hypothetical protein n=1 Tax=Priestia megaterium TaxID=1404 RepID=UPI001C55033F
TQLRNRKRLLPLAGKKESFSVFKLCTLTISIKVNKIFIISALVQTIVITLHIINYATNHSVSFYKSEKKLLTDPVVFSFFRLYEIVENLDKMNACPNLSHYFAYYNIEQPNLLAL